jgi:hypothetical protein
MHHLSPACGCGVNCTNANAKLSYVSITAFLGLQQQGRMHLTINLLPNNQGLKDLKDFRTKHSK